MDTHPIVSEDTKDRPPYVVYPSPTLYPSPDLFPGWPVEAVKQKRPETLNPFHNGEALVCTANPVQATIDGIQNAASGKKGWKKPQNGEGPTYAYTNQSGGNMIVVEYNPTDGSMALDAALGDKLWEQVGEFNDRDVDALLIVLAYLARDPNQKAWVLASDILDQRGIDPRMQRDASDGPKRRAGHRSEDIRDVALSLRRIANIRVTFKAKINDTPETDVKKGKKKQRRYEYSGNLIYLQDTWKVKEIDPETGKEGEWPIAMGWQIAAGQWHQTFLAFPNRQVALTCQALLKYNPYHEKWEKRIGYYVFFHGHMNNPRGTSTLNRTVGMLIQDNSLEVDGRNPQRTLEHFEKAMYRLVADGVIAGWKYRDAINLPARNWLPVWLNRYVSLTTVSRKVVEQGGV